MAKKIKVYTLKDGSETIYGGKGQFFYRGNHYTNKEIPTHLKKYFEQDGSMTPEQLKGRPYIEDEEEKEDNEEGLILDYTPELDEFGEEA